MQKTAYEMRISDWSSDVCSSDLLLGCEVGAEQALEEVVEGLDDAGYHLLAGRRVILLQPLVVDVEDVDRRRVLDVARRDQHQPVGAVAARGEARQPGELGDEVTLAVTDHQRRWVLLVEVVEPTVLEELRLAQIGRAWCRGRVCPK